MWVSGTQPCSPGPAAALHHTLGCTSGDHPCSRLQGPQIPGKGEDLSKLSQLKAGVDLLCRPCPWDWTFCQGKCYFFSNSKRNWNDAVTACQEVEA
ncbi:CD209 antigen-like protein 2 [Castor canadensis]|uniref:CD209 antigen-like protein 2 n=2 Tax=Castor canadensis TaxID=51338 RepID=A0AC58KX94_CASCN